MNVDNQNSARDRTLRKIVSSSHDVYPHKMSVGFLFSVVMFRPLEDVAG